MHMCVFRLKGRNDSGWNTRLLENWMMLKLLMVWLEKRPFINAEESWNQRCVSVSVFVWYVFVNLIVPMVVRPHNYNIIAFLSAKHQIQIWHSNSNLQQWILSLIWSRVKVFDKYSLFIPSFFLITMFTDRESLWESQAFTRVSWCVRQHVSLQWGGQPTRTLHGGRVYGDGSSQGFWAQVQGENKANVILYN